MPNRMVRDGMLESEAVLSQPVEGRWLYVSLLLQADDLGLFEATEFKIGRKADVNRDVVGKLMQMLADADLIRFYQAGQKTYGFIPKFRQRVQIKSSRHPLPPPAIYQDDEDALRKINELAIKTSVGAPVGSGFPVDGQPPEAELEEEEKKSVATQPRRRQAADRVPACPITTIVAVYHEVLPELPRALALKAGGKRAKAIAEFWRWVLTSTKSDGTRRAETAEAALAWVRAYFERARSNDFLMGRTPKSPGHENWECDLDYLCTEKGLKQVIEKTKEAAA